MSQTQTMLSDEEFDVTIKFTDDAGNPAEPNGLVTVQSSDLDIAQVFRGPDADTWTIRATGKFAGDVTIAVSDTVLVEEIAVTVTAKTPPPPPAKATKLELSLSPVRKQNTP